MADTDKTPPTGGHEVDNLAKRLEAFRHSRQQNAPKFDARGKQGSSVAFRLVTELVTGVLMGIGLGWLVDQGLGSQPWGVVVGTLLGFGLGFYAAARGALKAQKQMTAQDGPSDAPRPDTK